MKRSLALAAVLMLAVSALVVIPWGDEAACKSSAESTDRAIRMYKVTGGGQIAGIMTDIPAVFSVPADCTIGFTAQPVGEPLVYDWHEAKGEIQLVDHTNAITFHGTVDTGLPTPANGHWALFGGHAGRVSTSEGTFGVNWFCFRVSEYDEVCVRLNYGSAGADACWETDLEKGNITFHKPQKN